MKYLKTIIFEFTILIISILIISILYYFDLISFKTSNVLKMITFIITFFASGIYISNKSNKKYYLEGIKISIINILLFLLLTLLFKYNFNFKKVVYYIILSFTVVLGSMSRNLKKRKFKKKEIIPFFI